MIKTSKSETGRIKLTSIKPSLVNSWLTKNKCSFIVKKENNTLMSDCPAPWG